jgi:hypothetical protein
MIARFLSLDGLWGMPPDMLTRLPGYDPDVAKNRAEAKKIMERLGYGPTGTCRSRYRPATSPTTAILRSS